MKLDMDKYAAAMSPITVRINDVDYTATSLLRFDDAVRVQREWENNKGGDGMVSVLTELCALVGIPAVARDQLLHLPAAGVAKVITGFFASANLPPEEEP